MCKKNFIGLSILLLVLLLGLSTTCYARELSSNDVKNFCLNYYKFLNGNNNVSDFISFLNSTESNNNIDGWVERINRDNFYSSNRWLLTGVNGFVCLWYVNGSDQQMRDHHPYYYDGSVYVNTSYYTGYQRRLSIGERQWYAFVQTGQQQVNSNFIYTDMNIYTNSQGNTIKWGIGYENPSNVLNGEFVDDYFTFLLSPSIPTITINGDSVPYFNFDGNQANDFYLGVLGLAQNYYDSELFEYRYYQGKWKLNKITKIQNIGEEDQNLISVTLNGKYFASNTLYSLQMNPDPDSDFAPYSQPFFIKDRHTSITNGALDLDNTFSGDYYNNYNNDTNTNDIINSITDGNPDSELAPIETMLSGDAQDVANNFGFWSAIGPNLFPSNIYNRIYDRMKMVTDVLYDSGDVYFDFSMHGETPTRIHSSDIYLPNGVLKTFISTFLIAGTCWLVWKQFYSYYELITTGNLILLFHDIDIDKTIFKM